MKNETRKVKVAVFYNFSIFQKVISRYLKTETQTSGVEIIFYRSMHALLNAIEEDQIDVLFTEFSFLSNNKSWIAISKKFSRSCIVHHVKRVMLVANQHPYLLRHIVDMKFEATISLNEGIAGFRNIINIIRSEGKTPFVSEELLQQLAETDNREFPLSPKEWEVLYLVAQGYSISEIADRKNRANSTVATQKQSAMKKLNLASNSELIKYMYVTGMME
ncbi:helix-turn-helix transcriptional regulator [Dryocola sp. BD613]|uniref:helix-turn-helix transcriptional regulator n=1 Tax=Dryocola sp. BD613 TaxID=3133272 RepID=UPI003F4F8599